MHRILRCLAWSLVGGGLVGPAAATAADGTARNLIELTPSDEPRLEQQRPGGFGGGSGGAFVLAGGEQPGLAGGCLVLPLGTGAGRWRQDALNLGRSWGATAQGPDEIYCVGGVGANGQFSAEVTCLRWMAGVLRAEAMPPLPHALAGAGAAVIAGRLYVIGGIRSPDALKAEGALWRLDLQRPSAGWSELAALPGPGRVLPAVVAQYDVLQVFGGREIATGAVPRAYLATNEVWVYRPVPLEGTTSRGWERRTPLAVAMAGGMALPIGQAHTLLIGGDSTRRVTAPLQLNPAPGASPVRLYHVLTDAWVDTGVGWGSVTAFAAKAPGGDTLLVGDRGNGELFRLKTVHQTRHLAPVDYFLVAGYFGLLAGIGWYFSRRQESSAEFSLGSRSVQWWAAGISMYATGASAISFMAVPALAFSTNLVWLFPIITNAGCFFVQAFLIFPLLRKLQLTSTYEYLERRFNRPLRLIASAQQILFLSVGRAAVVLLLPALAIATTTGLNVYLSVAVMGVLTTVYATMGGFKAVIWTEVFQGALKFIAPLAMIGVALWSLRGGWSEFLAIGRAYHKFDYALLTWDITVPALWIMLLSNFLQFTVLLAGDQPMIQRVFSAPAHDVRRVAAMNVACGVLIAIVVNVLGLAIFAYFRAHPARLDAGAQNDQIVPLFAMQALPAGLAGVVIAAIFASAMATVASNMNSVATIFVEDFFRRARPSATDAQRLRMLKGSSYVVGLLGTVSALLLAGLNLKSMMAAWLQLSALLGGGIVGVYSLGMLSTRANGTGAICGAVLSVIITIFVKMFTPLHWAYYGPLAIGVCMGTGYVVSLICPDKPRDLAGLTLFTTREAGGR